MGEGWGSVATGPAVITYGGSRESGESSLSSLSGQSNNTTLSSDTVRAWDTGGALRTHRGVSRPRGMVLVPGGMSLVPGEMVLVPGGSGYLRWIPQRRGFLSLPGPRGVQQVRAHQFFRRVQSLHGCPSVPPYRWHRRGLRGRSYPGGGREDSLNLVHRRAVGARQEVMNDVTGSTHSGAGGSDSTSSTGESSSTLGRERGVSSGLRPG